VYIGSVEPGGAFYRDIAPGAPEPYFDYNQNTNMAIVPREQVFIAVFNLRSSENAVSGGQW
jgi:hypothetical protein